MYPNRIGFAIFGPLEIECLEIFEDGLFVRFEFKIEKREFSYLQLCSFLQSEHPTIAKLLTVLGREQFLQSVLDWNPSDNKTKDAFYRHLASSVNRSNDWDDHPY